METLNIEYNNKILTIKALNQAPTIREAAELLGVERHTVRTWIEKFDIKFNTQKNKYYGEPIQRTRVTEKV
jgi:transposase